jgi:hypothetical protein
MLAWLYITVEVDAMFVPVYDSTKEVSVLMCLRWTLIIDVYCVEFECPTKRAEEWWC